MGARLSDRTSRRRTSMRQVIMRVLAVVVAGACFLGLMAGSARAANKPITAGPLTVNPMDIIAVYRPAEQQAVVVFVGRPGQAIQPILFRHTREATQVFDGLWDNNELSKDAGDDDAAKPLTRMLPKGSERRL